MSKILKIALAVFMCFCLAACSGSNDEKENSVVAEKFANVSDAVVYIVDFSINPSFELHLDDAGFIVDFHCLNDDAKTAFENINVIENYCEVGINELLTVAKDKGYLVDGSEIEVTSYISKRCTISDMLKNNIEETLKNYLSAVDFTYFCKTIDANGDVFTVDNSKTDNGNNEMTVTGSEANENNTTVTGYDETRFIEVEKDENGNVVKTVELDSQDRTLTRYYNSQNMMICENVEDKNSTLKRTFDDDGILVKEEYYETNGNYRITDFDKDGNLEKDVEVLNEGLSITRYYASGILEKMEQISPEGKEVAYYDANGIIEKVVTTSDDGATHTMQYVNGIIATDEWNDPNTGISAVATYNNGVIVSHIKNGNNGFYEHIYYDANGSITEILDVDNQGRDRKKIYNSDGSCSVYMSVNGEWVEVID